MTRKVTHTDKLAQPKRRGRPKNKPLFQDDKEYELFWKAELASIPRLAIPLTNSDGVTQFHQEHIPELHGKFTTWLRMQYLLLRVRFNWPIYYWHVRHWHSPYTRKCYDLMFAAHVICDHDGKPSDRTERRHYGWVQLNYGAELDYFTPVFEAQKEGKHTYWSNEYAQGYADRWVRKPYPELIMLFHGMSASDFLDYQEYEDHYLKKELKKKLAQYSARRRWSKAKSK